MTITIPGWGVLVLLCMMLSPVFAAKENSSAVEMVFSESKGGDRILVVTCDVRIARGGVPSPEVTVFLLDMHGTILRRMAGYGGRYYRPSLIARLDRQAASAVTASPVMLKVKQAGVRKYQFVFYDLPSAAKKVEVRIEHSDGKKDMRVINLSGNKDGKAKTKVSPQNKTIQKVKPPVVRIIPSESVAAVPVLEQKESVKAKQEPSAAFKSESAQAIGQRRERDLTRTVPARNDDDAFFPSLVGGSGHVEFAERFVVVSYLDDELRRLHEDERGRRVHVSESESRTSELSPEQVKAALAPHGVLPVWEFLSTGMDFDTVPLRLAPDIYPSAKAVQMVVTDCVGGLCEYVLKDVPGANVDYRFYFKKKTLKSMVLVLPFADAAKRRAFLEELRSIYGGDIMDRGVGPELGDMVSRHEYSGRCNGMLLETSGKLLRVITL